MTISNIPERKVLQLHFDNGVIDGKQHIKARSYTARINNITDEEMHAVAMAIANLSTKSLLRVLRQDTNSLVSE